MKHTASVVTMFAVIFALAVGAWSATRKAALINQATCVKCGTCIKNCPVKAISKVDNAGKVSYVVDPAKCIACGTCIKNCPTKSISLKDWDPKTKAYAGVEAAPAAAPASKK